MDPFIGQIMMFAGGKVPHGWAKCEGQLLPISQNASLFSIIGTAYGGNGRSTFALPNLIGRCAIGLGDITGSSHYRIGDTGGAKSHHLTTQEMPSHTHVANTEMTGDVYVNINSDPSDSPSPKGTLLGMTSGNIVYNEEDEDGKLGGVGNNLAVSVTNIASGGNLSHNNMQPYIAMNYIIALVGIYPTFDNDENDLKES